MEITLIQNIKLLEKEAKKQKEKYGEEHELTQAARQRVADFRRHVWVRRILPAIAWRDEKQHLLIMTTQKMVSSFYDGHRKVKMSSKELRNYIISSMNLITSLRYYKSIWHRRNGFRNHLNVWVSCSTGDADYYNVCSMLKRNLHL